MDVCFKFVYELSKIVSTVGKAFSRVPVDFVVSKSMVFRNVIVDITISHLAFVFSQSRVKVLPVSNVGGNLMLFMSRHVHLIACWEVRTRYQFKPIRL